MMKFAASRLLLPSHLKNQGYIFIRDQLTPPSTESNANYKYNLSMRYAQHH